MTCCQFATVSSEILSGLPVATRQHVQQRSASVTKFSNSFSPTAWLFSGWNCVANTLPFHTDDAKDSPYVVRVATMLSSAELTWRGKIWSANRRFRLVISTAVAASLLLCLYAIAVVPVLARRSKVKPIAAQIDRLVPDSEVLYALDPDFQPFLFYVRSRLVYVSRLEDVPLSGRYLLIQPEREPEVMQSSRWLPLRAQAIERITDYRKRTIVLAKVGEG